LTVKDINDVIIKTIYDLGLKMKISELKRIREKLGYEREEFAKVLCLSSYRAYTNIENGFRKPSKLTMRLLRYLDSIPKVRAVDFIEEFIEHDPK
jgi:transcriptional regulator with XRE-family HTH domain